MRNPLIRNNDSFFISSLAARYKAKPSLGAHASRVPDSIVAALTAKKEHAGRVRSQAGHGSGEPAISVLQLRIRRSAPGRCALPEPRVDSFLLSGTNMGR